ncbi:MAG: hypothetical protein HRT64_02550 [Erythrobacter sp.]|nr:hypothetical protein [Erythrobacter sp.]
MAFAAIAIVALPAQGSGQERIPIDIGPIEKAGDSGPPQSVDILVPPPAPGALSPAQELACDEAVDASEISGQIVVCGNRVDNTNRLSGSYADWLRDYAERSANLGAPPPPNVDGSGLPPGMAPIATIKGCFLPPCPKPSAVLIDVEALPPAPMGSDAYWRARGLSARDGEGNLRPEARAILEAELALPPRPDFGETEPQEADQR